MKSSSSKTLKVKLIRYHGRRPYGIGAIFIWWSLDLFSGSPWGSVSNMFPLLCLWCGLLYLLIDFWEWPQNVARCLALGLISLAWTMSLAPLASLITLADALFCFLNFTSNSMLKLSLYLRQQSSLKPLPRLKVSYHVSQGSCYRQNPRCLLKEF